MFINNNIYFIGLPGSGKSTLGRSLAKRLKKRFFDSDAYIVDKTGVSVDTIFELEGEAGFRWREENAISQLVKYRNMVLATGGGAVLSEINRYSLKATGYIIYLRSTPDFLAARLSKDQTRPLLTKNRLQDLQRLYNQRAMIYEMLADITYPIDEFTPKLERCNVQLMQLIDQ